MRSIKELRFRRTVRQAYDFSCGAAAVATLLTYHYDRPASEAEVFEYMWEHGDRDVIQRSGFSLLDMKGFLDAHGYAANGYRLSLDQLEEVSLPAIALITTGVYRHFVVIQGISADRILLADPALGLREVSRRELEAQRDPVLLVVRPAAEQRARSLVRAWSLRAAAPVERSELHAEVGVRRRSLLQPGLSDF